MSFKRILAYSTFFACGTLLFAQQSLDEVDRLSFRAGKSPVEMNGEKMITVPHIKLPDIDQTRSMSLSGNWMLAEDKDNRPQWESAIKANVPGSIHSDLALAGKIPDPMIGQQDSIAEACSYRRWWMKRTFNYDGSWNKPLLHFEGVANRCKVWLNNKLLGEHEGMFGGPDYEVGKYLKKGENELIVLLDPIPQVYQGGWPATANEAWKYTVAVNCVYGWHYAKIPSLGIWRPVTLKEQPANRIEHPFIATRSIEGSMRLSFEVGNPKTSGTLKLRVSPYNFKGEKQHYEFELKNRKGKLYLDFNIDKPQLWWPNDLGDQPLYKAEIFLSSNGNIVDSHQVVFGIRTIDMAPLPGGPQPDKYNWTFVINNRPMFVKGTGWCTMDALLDFSKERYERFLTIAKDQHIQMLRAWGGGLPETDEFYELCDELGILVMQEWPTAWNSHNTQPYEMLEETVVRNTLRLRNHPSLVMWGAGNESENPFGKAIDMMGKASIELDGTRPFHRGEAWGGSRHNYNCWWEDLHLNHNLNMTADFWGEFGIPSLPVKESVLRYLDGDSYQWTADKRSNFAHHMPIFGTNRELEKMAQYAGYFMPDSTLECMILGTQLAQVVGVRHTLERARTRWPECTGALYYKMNDNYPALSWSCVDYYGAIKPIHYFARRSFEPATSVILFDRTNLACQEVSLPYYLLDDASVWKGKNITVKLSVFNHNMKPVVDSVYNIVPQKQVERLPDITLNRDQTDTPMIYFKTDVLNEFGELIARNWYFTNYETKRGVLLESTPCDIEYIQQGKIVTLTNNSYTPAIGITLEVPGKASVLSLSDNYIWLDAGETKTIEMNINDPVKVTGWNIRSTN